MFQLRDNHIKAFKGVALDNFEERGVRHLRSHLPKETAAYTDDQLRQRVRECVGRAKPYGLTSERQIMAFADATYMGGEHFDALPGGEYARMTLDNRQLDGDAKATLLLHSVAKPGPAPPDELEGEDADFDSE